MTNKEAREIFDDWKQYIEINDKLGELFMTNIPQSLLPYPPDVLEDALNIVAEEYFNQGNRELSKTIQESIATLLQYEEDDKALEQMHKYLGMVIENDELKQLTIQNLRDARISWAKLKKH